MAKSTFPGMKAGSGLMAKLITVAVAFALLVLVVKYPNDAANFTKAVFNFGGEAIDGIVQFIRSSISN